MVCTCVREDWHDLQHIAAKVRSAKEVHYQQLTSDGISAFDGAVQLVQQAAELGMKIGVGSSGEPAKILHNLTSSGLLPLFDAHFIVSAAYVGRGKPAPDVYLEVLRRLGCGNPATAIIVEDSVHGLVAAKAAGAYAVGITNSLPASALEPFADELVTSLREVRLVAVHQSSKDS